MTRFLGLDFKADNTFIPRPETELLVEVCLRHCEKIAKAPFSLLRGMRGAKIGGSAYGGKRRSNLHILDIGTGSGNIAISLTKQNRLCKIVALDTSDEALAAAGKNAERHGVSGRIEFVKSDLFGNINFYHFDIIIANPPYIPSWEIETLADHVKSEPRAALDGGKDGLDFYKSIIEEAPRFLRERGLVIMEIGYNQAYHVEKMLFDSGNFGNIEVFKDSSNIDRVIKASRWTNS